MEPLPNNNQEITKIINSFFPQKPSKTEFLFFLKNIKHEIDGKALEKNLYEPIRDFVLRDGKRLRPTLFLETLNLFGENPQKYMQIAVAIETIHNATLVLDDIEDKAILRRGKPAMHKKFGLDTATNVGMSMHILPLRIILSNSSNLSDIQKIRLFNIYIDELINVSFGQALDIYWHKNTSEDKISINQYLEMVRLKTGSLMRMSLRFACAIANKVEKTEELFSSFAQDIGIAFQIIDDSLDLKRPDKRFGKAFGNDITEGKISLPVIYALESASKEEKRRLHVILKSHTRNKKDISEAINIITNNNGIEKSTKYAREIVECSWNALEKKWKKRGDISSLRSITNFLVERTY